MKKWKRIFAVVGLVLCSTCGGLAAGELSLRLVGPRLWGRMLRSDRYLHYYPWLTYHPILKWANRPGDWGGFLINTLGFRGPEISTRKPTGLLRIVCLGDSRTFGVWANWGFQYDNDYPAALERYLRGEPGRKRVEVINAGVLGYTSANGLAQLETQVLQLYPDIVTVAFGFNDHNLAWDIALAPREPRHPFAREWFYYASHSYWFQLGNAVYDAVGASHPSLSERWVDPEAYRHNLRRFAEVGRRHRIHVLFVSQALRPIEMGENAPWSPRGSQEDNAKLYALLGVKDLEDLHRLDQSYRDLLYKVADEEGVPVADASAAFAGSREPLFGQYDFIHCNVAGARVIADTIRQKLFELGWLSAVSAARPPTER